MKEPVARPIGVNLTALVFLLEAILLQGGVLLNALLAPVPPTLTQAAVAAAYGLFLALPFIVIAAGLLNGKRWAYWGAVVLCGLIILSVPGWQVLALMIILPPQLLVGSYLLMNEGARAYFR